MKREKKIESSRCKRAGTSSEARVCNGLADLRAWHDKRIACGTRLSCGFVRWLLL